MRYRVLIPILTFLLIVASIATVTAQVGTGFTFQGQLRDGSEGFTGTASLEFRVFDSSAVGSGNLVGGPIVVTQTISRGLVQANLDFGPGVFDGSPRWLELGIDMTGSGGPFTTLSDRIELKPTPYAIFAETATSALNVDDADSDPTNEFNSTFLLNGTTLELTDGGGTLTLNLSGVLTADSHSLDAADGLPVDAVFVDTEGNAGVGTTTPAARLHVFNPDTSLLGSTNTNLQLPRAVALSGNKAYVVDEGLDTLSIHDVSNPSSIQFLGSTSASLAKPTAIEILGDRAVVIDETSGMLLLYNVADPANVFLEDFDNTNTPFPLGLALSNNFAYVTDLNDRLQVYDLSTPGTITPRGFSTTDLSFPDDVAVSGAFVFVVDSLNNLLVLFNASDPDLITHLDSIGTGLSSPSVLAVESSFAYVADFDALHVFDASSPTSIQARGSTTEGIGVVTDMRVSNGFVYLTDFGSDELKIFDVSDPDNPRFVASDGSTLVNPMGLALGDSKAFVANTTSGFMTIFDVSGVGRSSLLVDGQLSIGDRNPMTPFSILAPGVDYPVGIRQRFLGDMEFTTADSSGIPTTRLRIGGGTDAETIEFLRGANGSETTAMIIQGSFGAGLVGIGTDSPTERLHVQGGLRLTHSFRDSANSAGTAGQVLTSTGSGTTLWQTIPRNTLDASDGDPSSALFVDATGNVGIGTTFPSERLHVLGNLRTAGNFQATGITRDSSGDAGLSGQVLATSGFGTNWEYPNALDASDGSPTNVVYVNSLGNTGVGTLSPSEKLHVGGNLRVTGALLDSSNTPGTPGQLLSSTGAGTQWIVAPSDADADPTNEFNIALNLTGSTLELTDAGGTLSEDLSPLIVGLGDGHSLDSSGGSVIDALFVDADGDIGIGTNTPSARVQIQGGSDATLTGGGELMLGDGLAVNLVLDGNEIMARQSGSASVLLLQAEGGNVAIQRTTADHPIHVGTDATNGYGAHLTADGMWSNGSSREFKTDFRQIDTLELLRKLRELPVLRWRYRGNEMHEHMGPTAEDFRAAFGLGHDSRYIGTGDSDGVALAAIQGLLKLVDSQRNELDQKSAQIEDLQARIARLEAHLLPRTDTVSFQGGLNDEEE